MGTGIRPENKSVQKLITVYVHLCHILDIANASKSTKMKQRGRKKTRSHLNQCPFPNRILDVPGIAMPVRQIKKKEKGSKISPPRSQMPKVSTHQRSKKKKTANSC
jgi:hypothetical protein